MENKNNKFLVILRTGAEDGGGAASEAFVCAASALALGCDTTIFMTGKGICWAFKGEAEKITESHLNFPLLKDLRDEFLAAGGHIMACSICFNTCLISMSLSSPTAPQRVDGVEIGGCPAAMEIALDGRGTVTF